jgi:hypothetical protein
MHNEDLWHLSPIPWVQCDKKSTTFKWRGELVQGTLYTWMELSQWVHLVSLTYEKSKMKLQKLKKKRV